MQRPGEVGVRGLEQPYLGQRLRRLRIERFLTQRQVAGQAMTASYVSLVEAGRRTPTLDAVVAMAHALGVSLGDLLSVEGLADLGLATGGITEQAPHARDAPLDTLIHEWLADDAMQVRDHATAAAILTGAFDKARDRGDHLAAIATGRRLQGALAATNQHQRRAELLTDLLDLVVDQRSVDLEVLVRSDLAGALRDIDDIDRALACTRAALARLPASSLADTSAYLRLMTVHVSVLVEADDHDELPGALSQLGDAVDKVDSAELRGRAHWVASRGHAVLGNAGHASQHLAQAHALLSPASMPLLEWLRFCRSAAMVALEATDTDTARRWVEDADAAAAALGVEAERREVDVLRARCLLQAGHAEAARDFLAKALEGTEPAPDAEHAGSLPHLTTQLWLLHAQAAHECGDTTHAAQLLRQAADHAESKGHYETALRALRVRDALNSEPPDTSVLDVSEFL
ncbi:XRE family transcriptional regulator [Egibacter rhizosphaerae]|uniref:XRE family transcriptional regulator n=1 Tax=Egibacter rhizosphaerae TaxID=1670831 RepID=A0A411YG42_9ACTN|nr:helix-turn-helix transcriptional regulator [Egibacter rhizosphaerae]QBI20117.1 XRE family transcriptional regulator [Egibacter rhizosphaerae]